MFSFPRASESLLSVVELNKRQQMISVPIQYKGQMALDPEVSFNIVFGDFSADPTIDIACDMDGIRKIFDFVTDGVLPRFQRFFP